MYIWRKGQAAGRVRLFVGNRGSGLGSTFRRVESKKSDPWTTLDLIQHGNIHYIMYVLYVCIRMYMNLCI